MKVNNIYTSVACNRTPESADWGINGLILYAASNSVVIFNPHVSILFHCIVYLKSIANLKIVCLSFIWIEDFNVNLTNK